MEFFSDLGLGFAVAFTFTNLAYCFIGVLVGTLVGVLPGLGPVATVAILLPVTYYLSPVSALIMLSGIYYGAQYGGSTTAILVNLPGETSSVVTCLDGHQMARRGRAGAALAVAALASLFAGCVATLVLALLSRPLASFALSIGPWEYVALMVLGLIAAIALADNSLIKSLAMIALGLLLGTVGTDVSGSAERLTMGFPELSDGIGFVPLAMGLLAVADIIRNLERPAAKGDMITGEIRGLWPTRDDFKKSLGPTIRGTFVGTLLGILPGGGAALSSFSAYAIEKRISRDPSKFGQGAVQGVAAPEAANNAGAQTSFIPLLTLGIPSNAVMALMAGAMTIQGIQPGPQILSTRPELVWGLIASMWIGNLMLVIINLPLIRLWVLLLRVPYRFLHLGVLAFCCIGVYAVNNSAFEVGLLLLFGVLGYLLLRFECPPAPLLLSFILGPLLEDNFRRAMLIAGGDPSAIFDRPLAVALVLLSLVIMLALAIPALRRKRDSAFDGAGS
jgi:putative tricarboxylic transport membrane protein